MLWAAKQLIGLNPGTRNNTPLIRSQLGIKKPHLPLFIDANQAAKDIPMP